MTTTPPETVRPAVDTSEHEASGADVCGDVTTFPSHAELARTLVEGGAVASLASLTRDGHPYASTVPISVDEHGAPVICVSEMAEHTHNLRRDGRASVLVQQPAVPGVDVLALARVTLVGTFRELLVDGPDRDPLRERHLRAHPEAALYVDFADFGWWRLEVEQVRYVGGFGVMGWTSADDYAAASPDPVLPHAGPAIEHLNEDHADACLDIVARLGGVPGAATATVTSIDRYGLTFDAIDAAGGAVVVRVAFGAPLSGPDEIRAASVDLVHHSRSAD